jgi:hypothetical protein
MRTNIKIWFKKLRCSRVSKVEVFACESDSSTDILPQLRHLTRSPFIEITSVATSTVKTKNGIIAFVVTVAYNQYVRN